MMPSGVKKSQNNLSLTSPKPSPDLNGGLRQVSKPGLRWETPHKNRPRETARVTPGRHNTVPVK